MLHVSRKRGRQLSLLDPTRVPVGQFELNRDHPLARGLLAAWIPGSIFRWKNLVGTPYSETPTAVTYTDSTHGSVSNWSSVTSTGGVSTTFTTALTDFTIETSSYIPAVPSAWTRIADKKYDTGFWFGRIGATSQWGGGIKQLTYPNGQGITITEGAWHQLVMSRSGSTQEVTADGDATTGSWACDGTALDTTALKIGYNSVSDEVFTGLLERLLIYNRALSSYERKWLYREPYSMFMLLQRRTYVNVSSGNTTFAPGAGAVTVAGQTPSLTMGMTKAPGAGAETVTGQTPTLKIGVTLVPGAGTVTVAGNAPTLTSGMTKAPGAGTVTIGGFAPSIGNATNFSPDAGAATVAGHVPTLTGAGAVTFAPGVGRLTIQGSTPVLTGAIPIVTGGPGDDDTPADIARRKWLEWLKTRKRGPSTPVPDVVAEPELLAPRQRTKKPRQNLSEPPRAEPSALLAANLAAMKAQADGIAAQERQAQATRDAARKLAAEIKRRRDEDDDDVLSLLL